MSGWAWGAGVAAVVVVLVGIVVAVVALGGGSSGGTDPGPSPTVPATVATTGVPRTVATSKPTVPPPPLPGETSVTLSRSSGPVGTSITVAGAGFDAQETVEIRFHVAILATTVTNASGAFSGVAIKVPAGSFKGFPYSVTATGKRSIKSAEAPFTVT